MRSLTSARSVRVAVKGVAVLGFGLVGVAVPIASADPVVPVEPGVPAPEALPVPAPAAPAPAPGAPATVAQASAQAPLAAPLTPPLTPPDGVSHLPSPDSLPPGTTQTAPEHPTLGYLKDVWNALRSEDVTASDALLLLAQRPVNDARIADSVPQSQTGPVAAPAAVPAPPAAVPAESATPGEAPAQAGAAEASAPVPPAAEAPAPAAAG